MPDGVGEVDRGALDEGLDAAIHILAMAPEHLNDGGVLVMEVGNSEQALVERFPEAPFFWVEFAHGGHGVCILTREQLQEFHSCFLEQLG